MTPSRLAYEVLLPMSIAAAVGLILWWGLR